jgi:ferrous iron transport protein B
MFMWLMFEATFLFGEYPVKGIEWLVRMAGHLFTLLIPAGILQDMIVDGIIGGVGGVIVFLPNILILFFFISIMEDTGYMARIAFIVDKLMHQVGLHGKSFIPLLMGFGCNVPAIMATRTIENRNDRLVTMLITPFMSCSARYPVFVLLISAFFDHYRGTILFLLYFIGIMLAALMALIFKKTMFRAREIPFVMELPPYRMPTGRAILKHTWFKGAQYLKKMGTVILLASVVIWALGYFPRPVKTVLKYETQLQQTNARYAALIFEPAFSDSTDAERIRKEWKSEVARIEGEMARVLQEGSFIGYIGKAVEPLIIPLGFDWRIGVSLVAGAAAKEVVVSTLGVLFHAAPETADKGQNLSARLKSQLYTDGPRTGQPVFTPLVAFSLMIFVLIYFPCIAVIAAIRKESGQWKWAAFLVFYTTLLAWLSAFLVYQSGRLFLG